MGVETAIIAAIAAAGTTKAIGAFQQGQAEAQMMNYNASLSDAQAKLARQQGDSRVEDVYRSYLQRRGQQQAAVASSGIDTSEGTPIKLFEMSAANAEMDALNTRYNAELEAYNAENQARGYRAKAKAARRAGNISAAAQLISTAAAVAGAPGAGNLFGTTAASSSAGMPVAFPSGV
jgi:hypothetical protein